MSYKSSRRRPRVGGLLFIFALIVLIAVIVVQLVALSARDGKKNTDSSESQTDSSLSGSTSEEPDETESGFDPIRIVMDFSTILATVSNE